MLAKYNILFVLPILWMWTVFYSCNSKQVKQQKIVKADVDTAYQHGSRILSINPDAAKINTLTNLGMLWGFLKYYHAAVNKGEFNMDAELFRVLPKILEAKNTEEENRILEQWVDHFGVPGSCINCREIKKSDSTKLMPDYGYLFDVDNLPQSLVNKLEFIKRNRWVNDSVHYYVKYNILSEGRSNAIFTNERIYNDCIYPDAGLRLLCLYRYWNMIQYFYPNRHLTGSDWNKKLTEFIPLFCSAKDDFDYEAACTFLIGSIHDSHATLRGGNAINRIAGNFNCPFIAAFIENKLVVTATYYDSGSKKSRVARGDIIEKIEGITVDSLIKKFLPFTPGSNYSTQLRDLANDYNGFLLRGNRLTENLVALHFWKILNLQVFRSGQTLDLQVPCADSEHLKPHPIVYEFYIINEQNIGYIYPGLLNQEDLDNIKIKFKDTKGIIIDMRCYPHVFMPYSYGAWLKEKATPFSKFSIPSIDIPGMFEISDTLENGCDTGIHYHGKLVIIVNEQTQSQAEFTTMALSTVPGAIVIGSTTAGADGNVSDISLPGGLTTRISGIGEYYPDGSETQRVGVKIDKVIRPTIKGIKEGRDELLEYAIDWINR